MKKAILVLVVFVASNAFSEALEHNIIDLGNFGGTAIPRSINNFNQITINRHVGGYYSPAYKYDYDSDTLTDLGSLYGGDTRSYEINDNGQIVGQSKYSSGYNKAFLYESGVMTEIIPDNYDNAANGISQNGKVVGEIIVGGLRKGFIYEGGELTIIDVVGVSRDIINDGTVVGWAYSGGAFKHKDGSTTLLGFLEGDTDSQAFSINNSGQIVGFSEYDGIKHAFVYSDNAMNPIPFLAEGAYNVAYAINDNGQTVGYSCISGISTSGGRHAFSYYNGDILDLGVLNGATWSEAFGINDNGWIVGMSGGGTIGDAHAILWQPIPEPSTIALISLGILFIRKRR
jgi:probable HAF family extracellular repeat protein